MAFVAGFEWWTGFDQLNAADVLQDATSGSISGTEAGLLGEGRAITLPTNLLKSGGGDVEVLGHVRGRYDSDAIALRVHTGTGSGPYVQVASGTITVHRSDGALIGTASAAWPSGAVRSLSFAVTMNASSSGKVKLWLNSTVVLDLSGVQTVPGGGSTTASGVELHQFGAFDDWGFRVGSGGWVDADVPIFKWCRTRVATATGTLPNPTAAQGFTPQGSGSGHLARVNETFGNGDTNSVDYPNADGSIEGYYVDALPGNVGTVWGVQQVVQARDTGSGAAIRLETRDAGGSHAITGSTALTSGFQLVFKFHKVNPGTGSAWGSEYSTTQFEVILTTGSTGGVARISQYANVIVGDAPPSIELAPSPAVLASSAPAPALSLTISPDPAVLMSGALVVAASPGGTTDPCVLVSSAPDVTVTFTEPPPSPPEACNHDTEPAYLAMLQKLLPRGAAWTRDPEAVLTALLSAFAGELSCFDARARTLLLESDPRTTLEMLDDWEAALALPDPCTGPLPTIGQRRQAILAKLTSQGGASPAYFERVLASLGFPEARVREFLPFQVGRSRVGDAMTSPQKPFRVGGARVGDALTNNERWLYAWAIEAPELSFHYFSVGQSAVGEPLRTWGNTPLECVIARIAPAHTFVLFFYFVALRPDPAVATLSAPAVSIT